MIMTIMVMNLIMVTMLTMIVMMASSLSQQAIIAAGCVHWTEPEKKPNCPLSSYSAAVKNRNTWKCLDASISC